MTLARTCIAVPATLASVVALSGCSLVWNCTDTTAKRGKAAAEVRIVDTSERPTGATAEIVDWRLEPHPQTPAEGDQVHFRVRFGGAYAFASPNVGPAVDSCAVDEKRVALGCRTVHSSEAFGPADALTADPYLAVDHPERVAKVLLIPNDQSYNGRTCDEDLKDGGGHHPPESPSVGDQL
ncbi:hypothetical protein ACTWJ8_34245 [Streptomyces sp. SDT5-1]|uniref:hypothetical protein n=1 Tax=Streptomyces sp. SDT5-1 TaxID=3406418 RepID=UPI003FD1FC2D